MEQKKFFAGILAVLVILLIVSASASVLAASSESAIVTNSSGVRLGRFSQSQRSNPQAVASDSGLLVMALAPGELSWQQMGANGFGDPQADEVSALEAFNGHFYAGTSNATAGARIFRSPDGATWTPVTEPGFGIPHDTAPPAILDLTVFNGRLYAGTGRGDGPGQIWRTLDGVNWAPMVIAGFSDPDTVDITALAVYNGSIYAGATNLLSGAQIWHSYTGDNNSWTQVAPATPGTAAASITGFAEFDGALYAVVESDAPLQIWRSYGGDWSVVVNDGFGNNGTTLSGGMAVFAGSLYVGAGNTTDGAQLWRTADGVNWEQAITPALGDAHNEKVEAVLIFQNTLYVSVKNGVTGIEFWRFTDGTLWEQVNQDGFGDGNNSRSNWSNASADYLGNLYVGTANAMDGGELWRMGPGNFYGVTLSGDDSRAGLPGASVTYTLAITNSGNVTDSYDLVVAGSSWSTAQSTSTITLPGGTTGAFTVTVDIPAGVLAAASDTATVTATSQGDAGKSATADLTTTVLPIYGVALSGDDSLAGLPGASVTYSLAITNGGNLTDSYDLAVTGNSWATALSTSTIVLPAGAAGAFSVTVNVPAGALGTASDVATVTANSWGDGGRSATADLTTTVLAIHAVALSGDDSLAGLPGASVTYSLAITNGGNVTDTFSLAISGNGWTTTLSVPVITLAAGTGDAFTVNVDIPPGALGNATDIVMVTATSLEYNLVSDSAVLATTCMGSLPRIYLPMMVRTA